MAIVTAAGYEQVMGDIDATLNWVSGQLWANADKVGITGFCWGGKIVWQASARFAAIDAGVAWYGTPGPLRHRHAGTGRGGTPLSRGLAGDLHGVVIGNYGGLDAGIPLDSVEAMNAALEAAGPAKAASRSMPTPSTASTPTTAAAYRAADAADGWARLTALFEAKLK